MPLERVLTAGLYGDEIRHRDDMAAFYAQSWLIVHHAVFESPTRYEQLRRYRQLLVAEIEPRAALNSAFGSQLNAYERELSRYGKRDKLAYVRVPVDSLNTQTPDMHELSESDGLNAFGRWLVYTSRVEDPQLKFLGELAKNVPPESVAALQFANALIQRGELSKAKPMVEAGCVAPTVMRIAVLCGDAVLAAIRFVVRSIARRKREEVLPGRVAAGAGRSRNSSVCGRHVRGCACGFHCRPPWLGVRFATKSE